MDTGSFGLNWVDLFVAIILFVGIMRGRKRGMSEELLDIIKWAVIVTAAAMLYQPCGQFLNHMSVFSLLSCYVATYTLIALIILLLFSLVRQSVGEKLVGADTFGSAEYYLGMVAGFFRYACIVLVGMAFLNARAYSPSEIQAKSKYQQDNFGSSFFLTLPDLQREVFVGSFTGKLAHDYLQVILIRPTPGEGGEIGGGDNIARRRENSINEILDKKKVSGQR